MCAADKDSVKKGELARMARRKARYSGQQRLQTVQDFDVLGAEGLFFFCTSLKVSRQGISSSISLALTIVNCNVIVTRPINHMISTRDHSHDLLT